MPVAACAAGMWCLAVVTTAVLGPLMGPHAGQQISETHYSQYATHAECEMEAQAMKIGIPRTTHYGNKVTPQSASCTETK